MDKEEYYKSNAKFYEAAWKRSAAERNRDETRLNMKARWLAEQLEKVEQALNPFGFIRRDPPRDAETWLRMADSAVEHIEMVSKYANDPKYKSLDDIEFCHGGSWEAGFYAGFDPESGTHAVTDKCGKTIHGIRDTHLRHRIS